MEKKGVPDIIGVHHERSQFYSSEITIEFASLTCEKYVLALPKYLTVANLELSLLPFCTARMFCLAIVEFENESSRFVAPSLWRLKLSFSSPKAFPCGNFAFSQIK